MPVLSLAGADGPDGTDEFQLVFFGGKFVEITAYWTAVDFARRVIGIIYESGHLMPSDAGKDEMILLSVPASAEKYQLPHRRTVS